MVGRKDAALQRCLVKDDYSREEILALQMLDRLQMMEIDFPSL